LHLKQLAEECRRLAEAVHDDSTRRELILVAERFERLARVRERGRRGISAWRDGVC
jgi:hypothetical protein